MTDIISGIGETMADTDKDTANEVAIEKAEIRSNAEILASNERIEKMDLLSRKLAAKKAGMTREVKIHMTGTMTNPMSVDLRLWMNDRLSIYPCLTFVRFITLLLLYILNCSTFSLIKTLEFMILMLYFVPV